MVELGVNIDHVATLRQARYRDLPDSPNTEPSILTAAKDAEAGGAHGITVHLRADRRHIQDRDVRELREAVQTKLNLEMGNTPEILDFALDLKPQDVCMVPEEREEVTTEGGLDCRANWNSLKGPVTRLVEAGIRVSMFLDPEEEQVRTALDLGAACVELHTGAYANANPGKERDRELRRLIAAADLAFTLGLRVHAGHGLNYENVGPVLKLPGVQELNIGHSIVSRAVFVGLKAAVAEMAVLLSIPTQTE